MFTASASTFESPLSTYVHFMFSSFHPNTSKTAVFSYGVSSKIQHVKIQQFSLYLDENY